MSHLRAWAQLLLACVVLHLSVQADRGARRLDRLRRELAEARASIARLTANQGPRSRPGFLPPPGALRTVSEHQFTGPADRPLAPRAARRRVCPFVFVPAGTGYLWQTRDPYPPADAPRRPRKAGGGFPGASRPLEVKVGP